MKQTDQDLKDAEEFADSESRKKYSHTIYAAALDGFKEGRRTCFCRTTLSDEDIISMQGLVARSKEIKTAIQAERERCARIVVNYHGCSGLQISKVILAPTPDQESG